MGVHNVWYAPDVDVDLFAQRVIAPTTNATIDLPRPAYALRDDMLVVKQGIGSRSSAEHAQCFRSRITHSNSGERKAHLPEGNSIVHEATLLL